jgi:hypothetical protein
MLFPRARNFFKLDCLHHSRREIGRDRRVGQAREQPAQFAQLIRIGWLMFHMTFQLKTDVAAKLRKYFAPPTKKCPAYAKKSKAPGWRFQLCCACLNL